MFGYLIANVQSLSKQQNKTYKAYYCGLCNRLNNLYGNLGRSILAYDFTFIQLLLSSVYQKEKTVVEERCPLHPFRNHTAIYDDISDYCAQMNLYLSYYKAVDDKNDDHSLAASRKAARLKKHLSEIEKNYPDHCKVIRDDLEQIWKMEKDNILNPDLLSNCFGHLMGRLFVISDDQYSQDLNSFGFHIGRFIYLMDAVMDLKQDIKKEHFNPLVSLENTDYEEMLLMVMEDVDNSYRKLPLHENKDLIENILYSGIWSKYQLKNKKKKKGAAR